MTNKKQAAKRVLLSAAWAVSVFVLWPRVKQVNATVTHEFSDPPEAESEEQLLELLTNEERTVHIVHGLLLRDGHIASIRSIRPVLAALRELAEI